MPFYVVDKDGCLLDGPYRSMEDAYCALEAADREDEPRVVGEEEYADLPM